MITVDTLRKIGTTGSSVANMTSIVVAMEKFAPAIDLIQPHRIVHYLAQIAHESGAFRYDKEIWGPTTAQKGYEGRKDLGNTQPGDGKRFMGRSGLQLTGRANYRSFTKWAKAKFGGIMTVPDFEAQPDLINTDPWEGLVPLWYWDQRDEMLGLSDASSMNALADKNDIETITRRVNGGLNGFADRCNYFQRGALVIMGYAATDVGGFQAKAKAEGLYSGPIDSGGPATRAAMFAMLKGMPALFGVDPIIVAPVEPTPPPVIVAPLTVEERLARLEATVYGAKS